jgi:hypothetical protein
VQGGVVDVAIRRGLAVYSKLIRPKQWIESIRSALKTTSIRKPLFILGLICNFCVFALPVEKQIQIPWLTQKIYKRVNALTEGFNKVCGLPMDIKNVTERYRQPIYGDLKLYPSDTDFSELSNFILADLSRPKSEYFAKTWDGERMSFEAFKQRAFRDGFSKMTYSGIPGNRSEMNIPAGNNKINIYLNNSSNPLEDYAAFFVYALDKGIDKERKWSASIGTTVFYLLGLCIQLLLFDWRGSNKHRTTPKRTMSPDKANSSAFYY